MRPLFERIRASGAKIALASSGKRTEVEHYMEILGIADLVDVATSSDDADRSKPHPDIFEAALKKLDGISPDAMIVVGDTPYDAEAAAKAGLRTIGVLCGGFPEAELSAAGCVAIYRDPQDLLDGFEDSPLATRLSAAQASRFDGVPRCVHSNPAALLQSGDGPRCRLRKCAGGAGAAPPKGVATRPPIWISSKDARFACPRPITPARPRASFRR